MIFMGDEYAASTPFPFFTSWTDPDLAKKISDGRRRDFERDGQDVDAMLEPNDPATHEAARLKWNEREMEPHRSTLFYYTALIDFRKRESLRAGDLPSQVRFDESERWIAYERLPGLFVALNFSDAERRVPIGDGRANVLFESRAGCARADDGHVVLGKESAAVLRSG